MNSDGKKKEKRIRAIDCVDHAVTFAGREYRALLPIVLIFHVPFVFLGKLLTSQFVLTLLLDNLDDDFTTGLGVFVAIMGGEGLMTVFTLLLQVVITGAVIYHVYRLTVFGDRPLMSDSLGRGFKLFGMNMLLYAIGAAAVYLLSMVFWFTGFASVWFLLETGTESLLESVPLMIAVGGVALVVGAAEVYLVARFGYTYQFVVCENMFIFAAMKASWKATKRRAWHVICVFVLAGLLGIGANAAVVALDSLLLIPSLEGSSFVISLVSALLTSVASVSMYVVQAALTYSYVERLSGGNELREYEFGLGRFFEERKL